ncbi:MAG: Na+/H+ antiporter subunit E [Gammaproteobacteria bacterium]|nr:MAG: Na+/H+ antiporter subunit E [Gammaproteobacteria bacterium]
MTMIRTWLPHPLQSLFLWVLWLLLVNQVSLGHVMLGAILGWALPFLVHLLWPDPPVIRQPITLLRFLGRVHWDILTANLQVAALILGPTQRLRPAFFELPLDMDNDFAIALLASTVSLTPGTVSADVSADRRHLLIHALDVDDIDKAIAHIKQRYESPLKEIFGC